MAAPPVVRAAPLARREPDRLVVKQATNLIRKPSGAMVKKAPAPLALRAQEGKAKPAAKKPPAKKKAAPGKKATKKAVPGKQAAGKQKTVAAKRRPARRG